MVAFLAEVGVPSTLRLQVVDAVGVVTGDDDLVAADEEHAEGQRGISLGIVTGVVTHVARVHIGEVDGLGLHLVLGAVSHLHFVTLLQIDGRAAQEIVVAAGMVVTEQIDDVQALGTALVEHVHQLIALRAGTVLQGAVAPVQRNVVDHKDGFLPISSSLGIQISLQLGGGLFGLAGGVTPLAVLILGNQVQTVLTGGGIVVTVGGQTGGRGQIVITLSEDNVLADDGLEHFLNRLDRLLVLIDGRRIGVATTGIQVAGKQHAIRGLQAVIF